MGRIIVGITGASGVIYGVRLLEVLRDLKVEAHLILTEAARKNIQIETSLTVEDVKGLAHEVHDVKDLAAPVSSGSFVTSGMVVAPCSIKTLSAIAHSYNDNLLVRAADVTLKESGADGPGGAPRWGDHAPGAGFLPSPQIGRGDSGSDGGEGP